MQPKNNPPQDAMVTQSGTSCEHFREEMTNNKPTKKTMHFDTSTCFNFFGVQIHTLNMTIPIFTIKSDVLIIKSTKHDKAPKNAVVFTPQKDLIFRDQSFYLKLLPAQVGSLVNNWWFSTHNFWCKVDILPETNSKFAYKNGWLEYDRILSGWPIFRYELLVLGSVCCWFWMLIGVKKAAEIQPIFGNMGGIHRRGQMIYSRSNPILSFWDNTSEENWPLKCPTSGS